MSNLIENIDGILIVIQSAKYVLYCKIKFNYHYNFQQILNQESTITTFDAWCDKYSILERFNNEIREVYYKRQLFSNSEEYDLNILKPSVEITNHSTFNLSRKISEPRNNNPMKTILGLYLFSLILSDPILLGQDETKVQSLRILFIELVNRTQFKHFSRLLPDMKLSILTTNLVKLKSEKQSYLRYLISKYQTSPQDEKLLRLMFTLHNCGVNKLSQTKKRELEKIAMSMIFREAANCISINDFMVMSKLYNIENIISPLLVGKNLEFIPTVSNQKNHVEELFQLWDIFSELLETFKQNQVEMIKRARMEITESIKYICQKLTSLVISSQEGSLLLVEEMFSLLESSYHSLKHFPDLQNMIEHTLQSIIKL